MYTTETTCKEACPIVKLQNEQTTSKIDELANAEIMNDNDSLKNDIHQAVSDIKTAVLQGQFEAAKGVNHIQLALYFGIGKYVSQHLQRR